MQGMVAGAVNSIQVNLDAAERTACYGSGNNNRTHFEFRVNTPTNQPVGFTDILGGLGDIKPVCVRTPRPTPSPGPRPLSLWPDTWTFGDGQTIEPVFNGVGPVTISDGTLPGELCVEDGQIVPCD
jgi:hypothetical protein